MEIITCEFPGLALFWQNNKPIAVKNLILNSKPRQCTLLDIALKQKQLYCFVRDTEAFFNGLTINYSHFSATPSVIIHNEESRANIMPYFNEESFNNSKYVSISLFCIYR